MPGEGWNRAEELCVWRFVLAVADDFGEFGEGVP